MTKHIGIIGYPLGHTLSPVFQQAALDALEIDATYEVWATPPDQVAERIESLRAPDILGGNVTVPHKEAVIPYLDALDSTAEELKAVNTIVNEDGKLTGYNTDLPGFLRSLKDEGQFEPKGRTAIVVGSGGSARAIAIGLGLAEVASLTLINRTVDRAQALAGEVAGRGWNVTALPLTADGLANVGPPDLLVNCTPYGMAGGDLDGQAPPVDSLLGPSTLVVDLVYNPSKTPLLRRAAEAGARGLGGLPMLIYQGAAAFRIWTGQEAPVQTMFDAARKALGEEEPNA